VTKTDLETLEYLTGEFMQRDLKPDEKRLLDELLQTKLREGETMLDVQKIVSPDKHIVEPGDNTPAHGKQTGDLPFKEKMKRARWKQTAALMSKKRNRIKKVVAAIL